MEDDGVHVVFGGGQVGSHLAESLVDAGHRVRVAKRKPDGIPVGAESALGDAMESGFCRSAAADAAVVYHCMNPAYSGKIWEETSPVLQNNLIAAAGSVGARLVVMDNLYMIGRGLDGPINEETPFNPVSRKGEIRARLSEDLLSAHERGDARVVTGRASDFYGPRGVFTHFGIRFWAAAFAGKPADFLPNPDTLHTYHFIPDVAEGLKQLGTASDDVLGKTWMLPCSQAETTRGLVAHFAKAAGCMITLRGMPAPLRTVIGLFVPAVREVSEMLYQWDASFVVDDGKFRARFGVDATDPALGAEATVAWAREAVDSESR